MESYCLYGVRLDSDHRFRIPLWPGSGAAELRLEACRADPPELPEDTAVYRSPLRTVDDEAACVLHRQGDRERLSFPEGSLFELAGNRIEYRLPGSVGAESLELRFLGAVMAYWLETRGVLTLHASVVEVEGLAVGFLAPHGGGKSSLAATFLAAGHRSLADDLLAVTIDPLGVTAHAGYPAMRLWPDQVKRFLGGRPALRRVHPDVDKRLIELGRDFGAFAPDPLPLAAVYVLRLGEPAPARVQPVPGTLAVRALLQCSFSPFIVEAVGLQSSRLDRLARLAESVAIRQLDLPIDLDHLPAARRAVLADLPTAVSSTDGGSEPGVR
jgi:hypothetical protein